MSEKENHLDDVPARSKQLIEANFVFNAKENAFIKKVEGATYYMPVVDIQTMPDTDFNSLVAEAAKKESIGGEVEEETPEQIISGEVEEVFHLEHTLAELEEELSKNEQFRQFLDRQKAAQQQIAATWKNVESQMIQHDVKSIKGDWGSLTIAERLSWDIDSEELQPKFVKKVPDTTKISATFKLEGKAPKGCTPKYTKYLTKRLK